MKIAGIVLAGGLSSRMGQDKAQLLLAQQTLLTRNVNLLSTLNLADTFISGNYEGFQCIADVHADLGPIGGLHACVEALFNQYDALFIIPVDMPLLSHDECAYLLEQFKGHPEGVFYEQAIFPMIIPQTELLKNYLNEVLTSPNNKQRSLYRLIKTVKLHPINYPIEKHFRFQNSNTPEQWEDCVQTYDALNETKELK